MHINEDYVANVNQIFPHGTNSTMFTSCCDCAICEDEKCCPCCGRKVIGYDAKSNHERGRIRWRQATATWSKSKIK